MTAPSPPLDPRQHAVRPDLADARLRGQVDAAVFVEGEAAHVAWAAQPLLRRPAADAPMESQVLPGESVRVFERARGWAWVQCDHDGYVGYLHSEALSDKTLPPPTHLVKARETPLLSDARQECAPLLSLSLGAPVRVAQAGERFHRVEPGGYVFADHLRRADRPECDWVAVAERLLGLPYLWGGRGAGGVDCSGLVQIALAACGIACPRDSNQQAIGLGQPVVLDSAAWRRGDLIYVPGHVVIDAGDGDVVHATGYAWSVIREPREQCLQRLAGLGLAVTAVRRPA